MAKRTNEEWLSDLKSDGARRENALADLRAILLKGLPYALSRWLSPSSPQFDALAEEIVQETLLRVLDHLNTFEGRSQFTTWANKIAVRLAISELRRQRWKDVSLDELLDNPDVPPPANLMEAPGASPETSSEQGEMLALVQRLIGNELTERQRQALVAIGVRGMPLEEVANHMGTNRNALYKLLHDARLRLKHALAAQGLSPEDVLASFEEK
jgi:RNA polymerase sigma-70 factor (ECF subfamily)